MSARTQSIQLVTAQTTPDRISRGLVLLLLAVAGALAWSFAYTCMSDVPTHIEIARVFTALLQHDASPLQPFYQFRPAFDTNFGTEMLAAALLPVLGATSIAKVFFTIAIVGIPAGIIACMRAVSGRWTPVMLLALPYGDTTTLASGNLNFIFSVIIGLFLLAAVLRHPAPPRRLRVLAYAACWLLMVLLHPAGTVIMLLLCCVVVLSRMLQPPVGVRVLVARGLPHLVAVLPALLLLGLFMLNSPPSDMEYQRSLVLRLRELAVNYDLYKLDKTELAFCLLLSMAITLLGARLLWQRRRSRLVGTDVLLLLAGLMLVLYCVAPNKMSGGDAFVSRIEILPWVLLLVWCSAQALTRRLAWFVLAAGLVIQTGFLVLAYRGQSVISADVQAYFKLAEGLPSGSIAVPVIGDLRALDANNTPLNGKQVPFQHLHNIIAADRQVVFLENWNAHYRVANVMFRSDRDPYRELWDDCPGGSPRNLAAGLAQYQARTGVRVEWLLLWRVPPGLRPVAGTGADAANPIPARRHRARPRRLRPLSPRRRFRRVAGPDRRLPLNPAASAFPESRSAPSHRHPV